MLGKSIKPIPIGMKRAVDARPSRRGIVISTILAHLFTSFGAGARTWKDASGKFEIEAEFVSADSTMVVLKKADGTEVEIALSKLSAADAKSVAAAIDPGSHWPSSAERLAVGASALEFLSKHKFPKPRDRTPDDAVVRASVEGLAMLASGDGNRYRDRIDECREFIDRNALRATEQEGRIEMSTRALSYALMFASEHTLRFNNQQSRRLAHDIATSLVARQAKSGGWSETGITEVVNATADGSAIALIAMAAVEKLGVVDGAEGAKLAAVEFLKKCTNTDPPGSGMVTVRPGGNADESGNGVRSMLAANAFSLHGEGVSPECASILAMLRKVGRDLVMPGNQRSLKRIEGEVFLALLYHRESKEDSANYWDLRLQAITGSQDQADGSFPDPSDRRNRCRQYHRGLQPEGGKGI